MKIILITGKRGAGKTEFAKMIAKNIPVYEMSEYVYREMKKANIDRFDAITVGQFAKELREKYGKDIVARLLWGDIKNKDIVVVSGARSPEEVDFFRQNAKVIVIKIDARSEIRYQRIIQRNRAGDIRSYEEFLEKEKLDEQLGVDQILEDVIIDNNHDINTLRKKIDHLVDFIL